MSTSMVLCSEVRQIALSSSVKVELDAMSSLKQKSIFFYTYLCSRQHWELYLSEAVKVKQLYKQCLKTDGNILSVNNTLMQTVASKGQRRTDCKQDGRSVRSRALWDAKSILESSTMYGFKRQKGWMPFVLPFFYSSPPEGSRSAIMTDDSLIHSGMCLYCFMICDGLFFFSKSKC